MVYSTRSFTHLHTHTEYSMLDGASRLEDLVAAAWPTGNPPWASPTTGTCTGCSTSTPRAAMRASTRSSAPRRTWRASPATSVPCAGARSTTRAGTSKGGEKLYYHLTLLAETTAGTGTSSSFPRPPTSRATTTSPASTGSCSSATTTASSPPPGASVASCSRHCWPTTRNGPSSWRAASRTCSAATASSWSSRTTASPQQKRTNPALVRIARQLGAPLLATNDSHYTHREDSVAHDALLCVQTGALIDDPKRFKFEGEEHYLKSAAEMRSLFAELPEACDNTLLIAERANVEIEFGVNALPNSRCRPTSRATPTRQRADAYLRHLTLTRAESRYGPSLPSAVRERLDYELGVIASMGFSAYFLVVWDLIRHARESGIRVGPGRGSAAGCCVAYCLGIVDLDPIRYDLLFERFLNPGRKQMPDIDMDFDERYRGEMIRYATERYGADRVAQIVTFSTIKARAAVRDAARVLGYPYLRRRPDRQGHAAAHHGSRHPLRACLDRHRRVRRRVRHGAGAAGHVRHRRRGQACDRRGQGPRGPAAPGRHPCRRRRHHQGTAHRVPPHPAQARERSGSRRGAHRHPVRDARCGGARVAQDGLPRLAQPLGHRTRPGPGGQDRGTTSRHRLHPPRRPGDVRHVAAWRLHRRVPARGRPHALAHAIAGADRIRRRGRVGGALPPRPHGGQHAPATTRTGRTTARPSATSTPISSPSWATPTGS